MKNFLMFFLFSFFIEGVFGEPVSVSVTEGDSVTLHTGLTEIQEDDVLQWRFGAKRDLIGGVINSAPSTYDDVLGGIFRDRLKLHNQTGDLTITNITTKHAGPYEIAKDGILLMSFSVIFVSDEKKPSVLLGEYVTLPTGVTNTQMYDVIKWKFGDQKYLIAEVNKKTGNVSYYDDVPDGRFKGRLQLDYWTGSLTITNTRPEHTGVYEVDLINSSKYTIHKIFSVTVKGKIQSVPVNKGETITLHTDTVLKTYDTALWMFGDTFMVSIQKNNIIDVSDERFKNRLKLDHQTGSLTITDTRTSDSGEYDVKISSSKEIIHKKFNVMVTDPGLSPGLSPGAVAGIVGVVLLVCAAAGVIYYRHKNSELVETRIDKPRMLSVMERESITLNPDEVHKDDKLVWMFRGSCIVERKSAAERKSTDDGFTLHDDLPDGRFEGRLELDHLPGSLIIMNTRTTDSGDYQLLIIRPGIVSIKRFCVSVINPTDNRNITEENEPLTNVHAL